MYARKPFGLVLAVSLLVSTGAASGQTPMGTGFTDQGRLTDDAGPAEQYDFQFKLCDDPAVPCQVVGTTVADYVEDHQINYEDGGLFTVEVDFGADVFNGDARWLELGVRPAGSGGDYTILAPRQKLTPTPHALALPTVGWRIGMYVCNWKVTRIQQEYGVGVGRAYRITL